MTQLDPLAAELLDRMGPDDRERVLTEGQALLEKYPDVLIRRAGPPPTMADLMRTDIRRE